MELVRGTPLDRVLEGQGPVPLQRLVPLVERICEVVHSAHEEGIIHRDLKPANVVVISRSGRLMPKLLDFGIAKLREDAFHADVEGAKAGEGSSGADLPAHSTLTPAPLPPFAAPVLQDTGGLGKTQVGKKLIPAQSLMDTPAGERFQMALSMHLTQEGLFIGSPHYMAPEQWLNAASVDARTDLYALAVLTYQCLTGKLPFDGETLREVRDKHMTDPVPSVGPDFPAAMDAFFRKALGKMPEGRYPDALELGAALRAASGLAEERVQLPQLDELAREMVIAEAPQPLAEAVAALESARNAQHALELTRTALRTVVQFLGTVALAGRVRQGSGGAADTAAVLELLGKLRRSSLSELEWLELTYGLCVPFQGQRDVHPTPELVAFFCEPTPSGATGNEQLRELTQEALKPDANEDEARGRLTELLPRVATTLRELGPLFQYTLAYARQGRLEKWMGVRRTHRPVMQKAPEGPDRLLLTDAEGAPVVTLSPLAQVMAPSPGAPEEVFFLEGDGRHGAKLRALPSNFERHDGELWAWFREHLANVEAGTSGAAEDDRPPYLGLSSFSVADAKNFYGREQEAESFANRLRVNSLLAVVGPSGSGKSSFIQAGVLPLLPKDWRAATVRPGPQPLLALQTRLTQLGIAAEGLREELARRPEALGEKLLELVPGGGTLVLVVDQFEELITLCADADEREQYARALVRASDASGGRVRIIATLRDDFLIRCQAVPSLRERLGQGLQLLGTPAREDLLRILTEPARHAGYEFESPELPAEMVQAVSDQPGALALLSFTATRLWELRDRQLKRLTRKAYQALGGVGGALAHHAEATMGAMSEPAQKLVREAFRHLVTAEGTRAILSRGDMVQLLGGGAPADEVLESLIHARLLVASEGQGGEDRVEVIHEALLISWPRLVKWQREDAEHVRMRDQVRAAARQWEERKRDRGLLWRGEALTEYRLWRPRYSGGLTRTEEAFGSASLAEDVRGKRIRTGLLIAAFLVLAVGMTFLYRANGRATASAAESKARLMQSYEDSGRRAFLADQPMQALAYLHKALELGAPTPRLDFLLAQTLHVLGARKATLLGHQAPPYQEEYSPDGKWIATAGMDGKAGIWDAKTGKLLKFLAHPARVTEVHFSPRAGILVSICQDGALREFDVSDFHLLRERKIYSDGIRVAAWVSQGERMALGGFGGQVGIIDIETLKLTPLEPHKSRTRRVVTSQNGARLLSLSTDHTAHVYELPGGRLLQTFNSDKGEMFYGDLTGDGALIALGDEGRHTQVFDVATGRRVLLIASPGIISQSVRFSRDGTQLFTAAAENTARVWDARSGQLLAELPHPAGIRTIELSPDGSRVLTAAMDGSIRLWDSKTFASLGRYDAHSEVLSTAFAPDGKTFVTSTYDGAAQLWDAERFQPYVKLVGKGEIHSADANEDGTVLYTAGTDSQVSSYRVNAGGSVLPGEAFSTPGSNLFALWNADHSRVYIAGADGTLRAVDGKTNRLLFEWKHPAGIHAGALSGNGATLALGDLGGAVFLVDTATGKSEGQLTIGTTPVWGLAFSPDGQSLLTTPEEPLAQIWDLRSRRPRIVVHGGFFVAAAFSPDGRRFATGGFDKKALIWDATSGKLLSSAEEFDDVVNMVSFSPDGHLLSAAGSDGWARIVDVESGKLLAKLDRTQSGAMEVTRFVSGKTLLTGDDAGETHFWRLPTLDMARSQLDAYVHCQIPYFISGGQLFPLTERPADCR